MENFWQKLNKKEKPILALAPMAGVTDSAFRQICKKYGADVVYSEMASVSALVYNPEKTLKLLEFNKKERPYVVQLFGNKPEHFKKAVAIVEKEIKPDGIDINLGCPVPKVLKQGAGAALMKDLQKSYEVIKVVVENTSLPVSVKTRAKSGNINVLQFIEKIKDLNVSAIMIHGRTLRQGFVGNIDYEILKKAKKQFKGAVLGSGGLNSYQDVKKMLEKTSIDGVGIARGAMGRPYIFKEIKKKKDKNLSKRKIFKLIKKHAKLVFKLKGEHGIIELRKHLCWYVQGLDGASKYRSEFIKVSSLKDIDNILKK